MVEMRQLAAHDPASMRLDPPITTRNGRGLTAHHATKAHPGKQTCNSADLWINVAGRSFPYPDLAQTLILSSGYARHPRHDRLACAQVARSPDCCPKGFLSRPATSVTVRPRAETESNPRISTLQKGYQFEAICAIN